MKNILNLKKSNYLFLLIFILCSILISCSKSTNMQVIETPNADLILLAELRESDISLYASKNIGESGLYQNFILYSGNIRKQFQGKNVINETYKPTLILSDLNKDNKQDLIVKLISATGTGTHIENIYIFDKSTLKEFKIESIEDIIKTNVSTKNNPDSYILKIDDKIYEINKSKLNSQFKNLFTEPVFKNNYHYEIRDNKLFAIVAIQVSPTEFYGELLIEFKSLDNKFVVKSISFNENR